jgi:hypothetical protein
MHEMHSEAASDVNRQSRVCLYLSCKLTGLRKEMVFRAHSSLLECAHLLTYLRLRRRHSGDFSTKVADCKKDIAFLGQGVLRLWQG